MRHARILAAAMAGMFAFGGARAAAPDSVRGTSRWGAIPARADSNTAAFTNRGRAAWEWPLFVPYAAINYPLRWLRHGTGAGVVWLDEHGIFQRLHIIPVPEGVTPIFDYGSLSGFGFGINYYDLLGARDDATRVRAEYSTEGWQRYTGGVVINRGGRIQFGVGAGYRLRPNLRYYGIGPESSVDDEAFYKDERAWMGVTGMRRFAGEAALALGVAFSSVGARAPKLESGVSLAERFPGVEAPPGFGSTTQGVMTRVAIGWDTTREEGRPSGGGAAAASVGYFAPTDGTDVAFLAYRLNLERFLSVWGSGRALGLRAYGAWIDPVGGDETPFQRLFINELPDDLRGFQHGRWRDRGITGFTAEYRFPFVADRREGGFGLDTVMLTDVGQVFREFDAISGENLTVSYGFGLRAFMNAHYVGALLFVWSDEGFQFHLTTKQLFQFTNEVLYNGREELLIH